MRVRKKKKKKKAVAAGILVAPYVLFMFRLVILALNPVDELSWLLIRPRSFHCS
jgi:hypothetical protein